MARRRVRRPHRQRDRCSAQGGAGSAPERQALSPPKGPVAIIIRPEAPDDYAAIARVVGAAFNDPNVVTLVERIRASEAYVPELSLVAEYDGGVAGHVMFSYVTLKRVEDEVPVVILSPLAVDPELQRSGVGKQLVREGISRAEARNEPLIIVEGIPAYYPQFGFERARLHGIEPPHEHIIDSAWMALRLKNFDPALRGQVIYSPAFDVVEQPA